LKIIATDTRPKSSLVSRMGMLGNLDRVENLGGMEIPRVATHTDVRVEETDQAPSSVPRKLILFLVLTGTLETSPHHPDARDTVRLNGPEPRRQHEIPEERQHAR
jgi:hypothetical protein